MAALPSNTGKNPAKKNSSRRHFKAAFSHGGSRWTGTCRLEMNKEHLEIGSPPITGVFFVLSKN